MNKVSIRPAWVFVGAGGERVDPRLFVLLGGIHDAGKLTLAAKRMGLSYRHAWDLLSKWSEFFGRPLVAMERGKGAQLSPLGEKLLWAEQRCDASLFPRLANIASDLNIEINRYLKDSDALIRIHASHGFAVAKLPLLMRQHGTTDMDLQYMGSVEALRSLAEGTCDLAGIHVPLGDLARSMWVHYEPWIDPRRQRAIRFVTRTQGLMVAAGNPLAVTSLADLARAGIRFINRQKGSGTRFLLDAMLEAYSLEPQSIEGYERGEFTHAAVAAFVASGIADVGLGVEPAARQFKLDFIPLLEERYLLACSVDSLQEPSVQELIGLLKGDAFRAMGETGYALDEPGKIVEMHELFPWLSR